MKYNIKYTIGGNKVFKPKTKGELKKAVNDWIRDKNKAIIKYDDISSWDVSKVTDMGGMFHDTGTFNGDLSKWDVSAVTNMNNMFRDAAVFNQDLSKWDVSAVTNMNGMFLRATVFNQDLSEWNVSAVTDMSAMFREATAFNGNISSWNVSAVTDMNNMFLRATVFNQDINTRIVTVNGNSYTAWNVSAVTVMSSMFQEATAFNGNISSWNVSAVTDMNNMFLRAYAFNQDIGLWVIKNNCNVKNMFHNSIVTRQTFLPNPPTNSVTNSGQYGTGRGIYGEKIAEYFNPPLPHPKTIEQLKKERKNLPAERWQRRKNFAMFLSETKNSTMRSTNIAENLFKTILGNPKQGPAKNLMGFIG
jgi:surface protein